MIEKALSFLLVMMYSLAGLVHSCHSANNIAINKIYTVSPTPNYPLTALPTDLNALTDGKYTIGHFWTKKTTLGWQEATPVEILIDLGKKSTIEGITFNSARGISAGVYYPAKIDAFIGSDSDHFNYVGDLAKDPDNTPGTYKVKKFMLRSIGKTGRYLLLEVVPKGKFLFCDEIEVLGNVDTKAGSHALQAKGDTPSLSVEEARNYSERLRRLNIEKVFLFGMVEKTKTAAPSLVSAGALANIEQKITTLKSANDKDTVESDLFRLHAQLLRNCFPGKDLLIQSANPWQKCGLTDLFAEASPADLSINMPQGGHGHDALMITNLNPGSQQISISTGQLPNSAPELSVYQVPFVKSAAMEYVADPIVPFLKDIILRAGESSIIFFMAHGEHPGTWKTSVKIVNGAKTSYVPLEIQVSKAVLPMKQTLNSVNWGYLDFKPIRDRKAEAVKDLKAHHTNVVVVPPKYIPFAERPSPSDLLRLEKYLKQHAGSAKILFFLGFNNKNQAHGLDKYHFMSEEWKEWFKLLHSRLVRNSELTGFSKSQLYFYPYDEMKDKDIERFINLATWARNAIPGIKFYATIDKKEALATLPFLDIAQIINHEELYDAAVRSKKEIWLYATTENTKSLSPYSYYRLMPWKAFSLGFTGAGFWNYADTGWGEDPGSAWDDFDGNRPDFAVIYEGENGSIISSRRWEAWRMGVEDYELLTMYAKSKGEMSAKALAKSVLENPQDLGRADQVRQKILRELSR